MDALGRGEISPRLFEVYAKLSKQQADLATQITNTQNTMRKNYIDTYLDLQQKDETDEHLVLSSPKTDEPLAIENNKFDSNSENSGNVVVGTENVIKLLQERKKQALVAEFEEIK